MKCVLPEIRHNQAGFEALVRFYAETSQFSFENIEIDLGKTTWFDADMCASFGAILYCLGKKLNNTVLLVNISDSVEKILSKNGFLSYYGREKIPDNWVTTIPYKRFDLKDDRYFASYIINKLVNRAEMPNMSGRVQKKFQESIFEIFSNAVLHSGTELGIFCCGQYYPIKNQINFSVTDLGIGIRQNVKKFVGLDLSAEEAIDWATKDRNTTKRGDIPGGLGLKLLVEFIDLNGGNIQIVSDSGYWKREDSKTIIDRLSQPFPGTVVSIEIKTNDPFTYKLSSELTTSDIF